MQGHSVIEGEEVWIKLNFFFGKDVIWLNNGKKKFINGD